LAIVLFLLQAEEPVKKRCGIVRSRAPVQGSLNLNRF
jgi:hypothetical protein